MNTKLRFLFIGAIQVTLSTPAVFASDQLGQSPDSGLSCNWTLQNGNRYQLGLPFHPTLKKQQFTTGYLLKFNADKSFQILASNLAGNISTSTAAIQFSLDREVSVLPSGQNNLVTAGVVNLADAELSILTAPGGKTFKANCSTFFR